MDRRNFATRLSIFAAAFVPAVVRGQKPPPITVPGGQKQGTGIKEVIGEAADKGHPGVYGYNFHGGDGVDGQSDSGSGVHGESYSGKGVYGESKSGDGVVGKSLGDNGIGIRGITASSSYDAVCIRGDGANGTGVHGEGHYGVRGVCAVQGGAGVHAIAKASTSVALVAEAVGNMSSAAAFVGDVNIQKGNLNLHGNAYLDGTIAKAGGSFKIDHPLAPDKKYLCHSFVESPDMMNVYNGNVTTDASGDATVALPTYFAALNRDCRYQLTVIGQFAQAIVASEIKDNRFTIKTDKPSVKVSWQVTGIRQDAWANAHRIQVEEDKHAKEVGSYLHPEVFGQPAEKRLALSTAGSNS